MPRRTPTCPDCGAPLTCQACQGRQGGRIGGKAWTPKKAKALSVARRAPRPGRRVFDLRWERKRPDLPERASLAEAGRVAASVGFGAKALDREGRVVGWVSATGDYGVDA